MCCICSYVQNAGFVYTYVPVPKKTSGGSNAVILMISLACLKVGVYNSKSEVPQLLHIRIVLYN